MRSRDIKPGFFKNDQLAECSFAARLLFPGLWMIADREGRIENRPKRIKAEIFPYDDVDVSALLEELRQNGLIELYEVNGGKYIWIPTFKIHQNPHKNEKQSELPPSPHELSPDCSDKNREKDGTSPEISGQGTTKDETSTQQILLTPSSLTPDLSLLTPDLRERPATADAVAPAPDGEYAEFARSFQEAVATECGSSAPKVTDALVSACAAEIERCVRIDGMEFVELRRALEWARNDSFWAGNVRSLAQIRKKNRNGTSKAQNILAQYRRSLVQKVQPPRMSEAERREANNRAVAERVSRMMEEAQRRYAHAE